MRKTKYIFTALTLVSFNLIFAKASAHEDDAVSYEEIMEFEDIAAQAEDDLELLPDFFAPRSCKKATSSQLLAVNKGNEQKSAFMMECLKQTGSDKWCAQIERPNPSSGSTFSCTYGYNQAHRLINPSQATWKYAFKAITLIQKLTKAGVCVSQIYNWWRPEPYNANVGGAPGRHPAGTSVDVRFCSNSQAVKGFDILCGYRKKGELRALGYYGSTGVHFGIGDKTANTWGRGCK